VVECPKQKLKLILFNEFPVARYLKKNNILTEVLQNISEMKCKNRWTVLQHEFRWHMHVKGATKSGQAFKPTKPWKYESQMSRLIPCLQDKL
jgi:hypothetical protein